MISFGPKGRDAKSSPATGRRQTLAEFSAETGAAREATGPVVGHDWTSSSLDLRAGLDVVEYEWADTMPAPLDDLPDATGA